MSKKPNNYFKVRRERLMNIDPHCYWCGVGVVYYTLRKHERMPDNFATIDHLYSRFSPFRFLLGSAYGTSETLVLACHKCNQTRCATETREQPIEELRRRARNGSPRVDI